MATKAKTKTQAEQKKPSRSGVALGVYLPPELMARLERAIASSRPRSNKTAIVEMALDEWLLRHGHGEGTAKP